MLGLLIRCIVSARKHGCSDLCVCIYTLNGSGPCEYARRSAGQGRHDGGLQHAAGESPSLLDFDHAAPPLQHSSSYNTGLF